MLTKIIVENFKLFKRVEVELGNPVVFVGPNNSGKTSALQALALWDVGLKRWNEKRAQKKTPKTRSGVTINRKDLISMPVPAANLLWRNLHVRDARKTNGRQETKNVRINVVVEGIADDVVWRCGLEFDYANVESLYCRPLRLTESKNPERMLIPPQAGKVQVAFLPPMSGLAANETKLPEGAINVRIGEGRTAEVLRNLCYAIYESDSQAWKKLSDHVKSLFGARLEDPRYIPERGEIDMSYKEKGIRLDLSSSGRGLQQTLLLLAYMYANPESVLLLDEPDAHLEILRQRQTYQLLTDVAKASGSQIVAASHSEVLLSEAAQRDVVIAFVGKPHRIDDRGSQVRKALTEIEFTDYYLAEETGWVLYLEGSTDLAILRAFADKIGHGRARAALERPFVKYVLNQPSMAASHYHGLREACPGLVGVAVLDRLEKELEGGEGIDWQFWKRREIENYVCTSKILEAYAASASAQEAEGPLFAAAEGNRRLQAMRESIAEIEQALKRLRKGSPWGRDIKASDEFLEPLFESYFEKLELPNVMRKKNYHVLAEYIDQSEIDPEITAKLDAIAAAAEAAMPL